jgi:hypothetical protein
MKWFEMNFSKIIISRNAVLFFEKYNGLLHCRKSSTIIGSSLAGRMGLEENLPVFISHCSSIMSGEEVTRVPKRSGGNDPQDEAATLYLQEYQELLIEGHILTLIRAAGGVYDF